MHAGADNTWAASPGPTSTRCAGCGRVLTLTKRSHQPESADHTPDCWQYKVAVAITHYSALLAQATPEPDNGVTADDARSWQRYCQEAAHDLDFAAQATSVTDALQQQAAHYAKDDKPPDGTKGSRGRSAAAHMLKCACQTLSRAQEATPPRLSLS